MRWKVYIIKILRYLENLRNNLEIFYFGLSFLNIIYVFCGVVRFMLVVYDIIWWEGEKDVWVMERYIYVDIIFIIFLGNYFKILILCFL